MAKVAIYVIRSNGNARITCTAMAAGVVAAGDQTFGFGDSEFHKDHVAAYDAAIFWGYIESCQNILKQYRRVDKPVVYLDLAYWKRDVCFKIAVNGRHATDYFQRIKHDDSRRKLFGVEPAAWQANGGHILVAGMGPKAAWAEKEEPVESWERNAIATIQQHSKRPIIYRPKPNQHYGKPIAGTRLSGPDEPLRKVLAGAHAVVAHHSNVAVDGLVAGVPAFVWHGVAAPMGLQDLSRIDHPFYPADREQWLNDVAYCQWSLDEMKDGTCWRHLKGEGLVP